MAARYRLQLLGHPRIARLDHGQREKELRSPLRRAVEVLAYLASSPGLQASKDELVEAVWGEKDQEAVRRNFHPTLSILRRVLRGGRASRPLAVVQAAGVYRLDRECHWEIDLLAFETHGRAGDEHLIAGEAPAAIDEWSSAWQLYRGPFLQDFYEPWVSERRERYHELYLDLLRKLGDVAAGTGHPQRAMDAYRTLLREEPLDEAVHLALMRIYAGAGRRDLVRRQYARLCALLQEELGVEPLGETVAAYYQLMA